MSWKSQGYGMHMIRPEPTKCEIDRDHIFEANYIPKFENPGQFINDKIEILRNQFHINLTAEDIAHLCEFKTENEINAAVKGILNKYWR